MRQINKQQAELGGPLFANPRNLASGSLRQLDSSIAARRPLRFYAHSLGAYDEITISTQKDFINLLKSFSLPCFESKNLKQIPNLYKVSRSLKEILKYYSEVEKIRSLLPFEIDGIVIKINSLELQKQVGQIARSPRWAIASKFHPEESITQVKDIVLQVGRTGIVTPVAIMEPVLLSGVTIRQASLHNFKEVGRKDIRLNDFVVIHRAGDVIPEILKSLAHKRKKNSQALKAPTHCPVCKKTLYPDGDYLRCQNVFCDSIRERSLIHFASKKAMNIEFLGEKNIKKFYQWGWLPNFSSFYDLPNKPLAEQEGFGEKSYDLLLKSLENSKQTTLPKLLFSLGIQNIGEQTAQRISETVCKNLPPKNYNLKTIIPLLQKLKEEDLVEITDIGPTVAKSFINAFQNKNLIKDLTNLEKKGCTFIKEIKGTKLQGLQFVITGTFDIKRKEVEDLIKQQGGHVVAQISQKTNYLLIGNQPGSKKEKAKKLNIPLLQWEEFKKLSSL